MSRPESHIIRKQLIELSLEKQADSLRTQQRVSNLFKDVVLPKLAAVFDELSLDQMVLKIPHLSVDLGNIAPEQLDREFVEKCLKAITTQLLEQLTRLQTGNPTDATLQPKAFALLDAFWAFLETGRMPLIYRRLTRRELEAELLLLFAEHSMPIISRLQQMLKQNEAGLKRLVWQCSEAFYLQLMQLLASAPFSPISILGVSDATTPDPVLLKSRAPELPAELVKPIFRPNPTLDPLISWIEKKLISRRLRVKEKKQLHLWLLEWILSVPQEKIPPLLAQKLAAFFESEPGPVPTTSPEGLNISEASPVSGPAGDPAKPAQRQPAQSREWEGLFTENAGLVLLHPFLKSMFTALELMRAEAFIDLDRQQRALYLLHYLCSGQTEPLLEHELTLPKIICGWPEDEAVDSDIKLTQLEKDEAEELLEAVVRHWSGLKSTSTGLLRTGFLLRQGKLTYRPYQNEWLLQVERKGQDMLLEKLPWGFATIQLPWLSYRLYVDW